MRTFDDIVPPSRRKEIPAPIHNFQSGPPGMPRPRFRFSMMTTIVVVVIVAVCVGALFYFSSAKIEVTPNTISAAVQSSFTATQGSGALSFQIITAQKTASQSVTSSGTTVKNTYSSGNLTIYNTQTQSQRLITNTRFASPTGLIFRIHAPVTIPGGSTAKPGSVSVTVYADKPGDAYNIEPASFTIPGFAGMPQATTVYARSTAAMTGGASGTVPIIDPTTETQTRAALIAALEPDLLASLKGQIPSGYVLLPGAATTTYAQLTSAPSATGNSVDVKEQGTISAVVFPNSALASAIASSTPGLEYHGEPLTLISTDGLSLVAAATPTTGDTSFSFVLNGTASLEYVVDPARISATVAGESRSVAETILTSYPEVKQTVIILRPFWRETFPQDPASISVVVSPAAH